MKLNQRGGPAGTEPNTHTLIFLPSGTEEGEEEDDRGGIQRVQHVRTVTDPRVQGGEATFLLCHE